MCKRALFVFDWRRLCSAQWTYIQQQAVLYDECIFLIDQADALPEPGGEGCSGLMVQLHKLFNSSLSVPFYILPVTTGTVSAAYTWLRWRILCPAFTQIYTDQVHQQQQMQAVLQVPVAAHATDNGISLLPGLPQQAPVRGLFITRAQPFHNGHAAFIQQMVQEVAEIVVVIAMANRSHQLNDMAMAGERLAMVLPVLQQMAPGKYYLAALPYSDYAMENLYELAYLLPACRYVYTTNPSVAVMAETAGYSIRQLNTELPVSSTMIRERMIQGLPYSDKVPLSVYRFLEETDMAGRLQQLAAKEKR